ncbi:MAG TPA: transposase [Verrucomicrobiae bacterium]|jgi:REP element-mobilizing transposase RayT
MKPISGYCLIKPEDLHWRPSNLMRIPNADYLERTGSTAALHRGAVRRIPGARLCEPQQRPGFSRPHRFAPNAFACQSCCGLQTALRSFQLLRVIDPRSVGFVSPALGRTPAFQMLAHESTLRLNVSVSQRPKPRRPSPPHNPGVRDLVESKRQGSSSPKPEDARRGFRGWNERGYLPHRDEPGLTQFVTFRLADSFPESLRSEWEHLARIEDTHEQRTELEAYLDRGRGECHLRRPDIAKLVEDNFRQFGEYCGSQTCASEHTSRYDLQAWVVMPNHVHVLFKVESVPMSEIVGAWKKHTGRIANKLLGKHGPFWAEDYFDVFMREVEHRQQTICYIENNPTKAKLVLDPKEWPWSSARFRNEFGVLRL